MRDYCYRSGVATSTSATPLSFALKGHVGQFATIQRSLLLGHVALEQWPSNSIYPPSAPRASRDKTDVFTTKRGSLCSALYCRILTVTRFVYGLCMATKTICIGIDAYDFLVQEKKNRTESFSRVIRRLCAERPGLTAGELLDVMQEFKGKGAGPRRKRR